jgi:hypothetical protein
MTWSITGFTGIISLEATLLDTPTSNNDWFTVVNSVYNENAGTTVNAFINVTGNFVWLRAKISNFTRGVVNHIKVSY